MRNSTSLSRRSAIRISTGALAMTAASLPQSGSAQGATNKRIRQSIAYWCFNTAGDLWDLETQCQIAHELGAFSIELVPTEDFPTLKKHNLICAMAPNGMPGPPFVKGVNNTQYHDQVIESTRASIDACAEYGFPNVIAFTGYKYRDAEDPTSPVISLEEGAENSVKALKALGDYAKGKGVTVCIEHLNTRDDTHPMKGHPGYQGDDIDYVADIVQRVDSPNVKILFDIYHVQIMNGDVMRRIDQYHPLIGHIHTAGAPGRAELDENQELQYPPIMRKLLEVDYKGYVGQEFIPTGPAKAGLAAAIELCDV